MCASLFEKILVPYDGSKFSKMAVSKAIEVSDRLESKVYLFSVITIDYIQPPGSLLGLVGKSSQKSKAKILTHAKKKTMKLLESEAQKFKKQGRRIECKIAIGDTAKEILDFSNKKKVTLIIIGSQGLHGISKIKALGSTSRKISEFAHCPVLIVR